MFWRQAAALDSPTARLVSAGTGAAAYLALTGDLGASIFAFKEAYPLLVFPAKAVVAFPLVRGAARGCCGT